MSKINETNYPRRTQANYADTDMLVIQAAGGNTYTTRLEDMREDYEETLAPTLSALQDDVNENLATIEAGSTASQAYAKGDFLVFGGRLCKAKTSIAVNATLVLDTNIELASVGGELSSISSELANFQTFTAQSPSSVSGSKTTALPTGFNGGNCVIIGAKIELISNFYYSVATLAQNGVDLVLSGTTIYVTTSATTPSNYLGKDIIITLYKHA